MSNIDNVLKILANNSEDVETVVRQFGGIGNLIRAAPALLRIMKTISSSRDPVDAAERSGRALVYGEQTKERVERFQQQHGLQVDGVVGPETWGKVERLIGERP